MAKQVAVNGGHDQMTSGEHALLGTASSSSQQLPFLSLNHVSFTCRSVPTSVKFYTDVLGFALIRQPSSFDFHGAWLFNHGIGIHLLEVESNIDSTKKLAAAAINPKDNHISFQCTDMDLIIKKLEEFGVNYVTAVVSEGGVKVNQLFFHDPDGYMIEICNCHVLPVLPITSCPLNKITPQLESSIRVNEIAHETRSNNYFCGEDEVLMMNNLLVDMMGLSF